MIQRGGGIVIRMLENVQQATIRPLIERFITPGTRVYTDEYDIDRRLPDWGFDHRTVCHSRGGIPISANLFVASGCVLWCVPAMRMKGAGRH